MEERAEPKPALSVVVVVHDMAREAPRMLYSLSAAYQRHIPASDYEVVVVDNGSNPGFDDAVLDGLSGTFQLIRIEGASPSPAPAVNRGIRAARGDVIGVLIDGARIVTPGLLHFARHGVGLYDRAVVATMGWHLGFDDQRHAVEGGYDKRREDQLLDSIGWPDDGYRLFEIATAGGSSNGWLQPMFESNALFLRRELWQELGGFDERFDSPGGGLVNLDAFRRALELPAAELVVLLGEGTFHQIHGGIANNSTLDALAEAARRWGLQYESIRGQGYTPPRQDRPTFVGTLPRPALSQFVRSAIHPAPRHFAGPLGESFDPGLWSLQPVKLPAEPRLAALVELAHGEFRAGRFEAAAAVARLARRHAPDEAEPQRLLAHAGPFLRTRLPADERRAEYHLALGKAHRLLGDDARAAEEFRSALAFDADLVPAQLGLARLRLPGSDCLAWLDRLHAALAPDIYLEIGVDRGQSFCHARPPTRAVGVDPDPRINVPLRAESHLFCETSDTFFAERRLPRLFERGTVGLAFIDGLHVFEQSLKDVMNVEALCGPQSVVLLHDTLPFDEVSQRPDRQRKFYTGDVWKTVLCLRHYRPELEVFTIAAPPSGLTVVTRLDPASRVLGERYPEAVARFGGMPLPASEAELATRLAVIANDWSLVESRLRACGVLR